VGAGVAVQAFIDTLAAITGATSQHPPTVPALAGLGGDWNLEITTGTMITHRLWMYQMSNYDYLCIRQRQRRYGLKAAIANRQYRQCGRHHHPYRQPSPRSAADGHHINVTDNHKMTIVVRLLPSVAPISPGCSTSQRLELDLLKLTT